ncbi:MAG: hypothetical protein KGJ23_07915 [Euryarchaeota archaeon]|nr:hypothetical protein [Euryarchaeota archaeon]MDE1836526.1 hypothetical protein [Euryarchaeota archaeon]MDE1879279.1 hypothetical protein [Euryarchaeota archaeon]MDE2044496.1 hypothetical protein [Thermoplasmata archaeon]
MKVRFHDALEKALKADGKIISPESAVEIAEVVLRAVADEVERKEPYAKGTIRQLRGGEDALDDLAGDDENDEDEED